MERVDGIATLELLQQANIGLVWFFAACSEPSVRGTEREIEALLQVERTLRSVGDLLDGRLQKSENAEIRNELALYRVNLLRLQDELASLQESAGKRQIRLLAQQRHLQAARAWCAASRDAT